MSLGQVLLSAWDWEPSVVLGCAALMTSYLAAVGIRFLKQALLFTAGVFILLLALVSPLDTLGDHYLFSAHMLQHLLLILVIPPFFLLGIPPWAAKKILTSPTVQSCEAILGKPAVAWPLGIGALWVWHAPLLYNAALANEPLHVLEHLSFLVTSVVFWWPVLIPAGQTRLPPPIALIYLMAAGLANTLLGIILTFYPGILYPAYLHPSDPLGILHLIRNEWNISAKSDQTLGGLLMWVPGSFVYLAAILGVFLRWFALSAAKPSLSSTPRGDQPGDAVKCARQTNVTTHVYKNRQECSW